MVYEHAHKKQASANPKKKNLRKRYKRKKRPSHTIVRRNILTLLNYMIICYV